MILIALPLALCGALLFRIRGGLTNTFGFSIGTTASRLVWSLGMAACAVWATGGLWAALTAPAFFAGCILGFPACIDLGRMEGEFWRDFALLTLRGLLFTLPAGAVLWWLGHGWGFALIGLSAGVLYELGWRTPIKFPGFDQNEKGEAYFGAAIGAALATLRVSLS